MTELKLVEEKCKKINNDFLRLNDEIRQEEQHFEYVEKLIQGYELEIKVRFLMLKIKNLINYI